MNSNPLVKKCRQAIKFYEKHYQKLIDEDITDLPTRALIFNAYSRSEFAQELLQDLLKLNGQTQPH